MPTKERKNDFIQLGLLLPFLYLYSLLVINFFEIGHFHVLNIPLQLIRVELQNNSYYIFIFLVVVIFLFTIVEIAKNTFTTIRKGKSWLKLIGINILLLILCSGVVLFYRSMFDIFFIPLFLVLIYGTVAFLAGMKMGKENMPKSILEWLVVTLGKWLGPLLMVTSSSCIVSLAVGRFNGALKRAEMKEYQRKVLLKSYEEFSIYGKVDSLNGREVLSLFMTDSKVDTLLMDRISAEHQVSIQAIIDQQ